MLSATTDTSTIRSETNDTGPAMATPCKISLLDHSTLSPSLSPTAQDDDRDFDSEEDSQTPTPELTESPSDSSPDTSPPEISIRPSRQSLWSPINEERPKQWRFFQNMLGSIKNTSPCTSDQPSVNPRPHAYLRLRSVKAYTLYHILYQYQTTSLHVRPISWSDQHAKAFRVQWNHLSRSTHPTPEPAPPNVGSHHNALELSHYLPMFFSVKDMNPHNDLSCMMTIMWRLFPDRHPLVESRPDTLLPFWLAGRPHLSAVKLQAIWQLADSPEANDCSFSTESTVPFDSEAASDVESASSSRANDDDNSAKTSKDESPKYHARPVLGYVSRDRIHSLRHGMFRIPLGPKRCSNMPVINLHRKKAMKLRPAVPDEDMYIAASFIAMAQRFFYPRVSNIEREFDPEQIRPFEDVKLRIMVSDATTDDFIVYTTTVTKELLTALHNPRTGVMPGYGPLSAMDSLRISTQHVASRPVYGLRERLGKALGDVFGESFGAFPSHETEAWAEDSVIAQPLTQIRPPWGPTAGQPIIMPRSQEQLVRKQLKLKGMTAPPPLPNLQRRVSEHEQLMRREEVERKRHELLVLPFPPMPEGEGQLTSPKRKSDAIETDEEVPRAKRRRSMAL
ncbi:hypothetical protein Cpir12675_006843 [Ceratocystis pirilliformis]|uniref:Uncharacterized protein n=1 Tax=Ceratocystis pirilliformis TaxID=259994 RepID=A0ABR3YF45_9PEZI